MIQQSHSWAYVHTENMNTLIQKDTCKKKKDSQIIENRLVGSRGNGGWGRDGSGVWD